VKKDCNKTTKGNRYISKAKRHGSSFPVGRRLSIWVGGEAGLAWAAKLGWPPGQVRVKKNTKGGGKANEKGKKEEVLPPITCTSLVPLGKRGGRAKETRCNLSA